MQMPYVQWTSLLIALLVRKPEGSM